MKVEVEFQGKSKMLSNSMILPNMEGVNDGTFDTIRLLLNGGRHEHSVGFCMDLGTYYIDIKGEIQVEIPQELEY